MQKIVKNKTNNACGRRLEILLVKIVSKRAANSPQYPQKTGKLVLHCSCKTLEEETCECKYKS